MSKYKVFFEQVASTQVEVEADSFDEAVDKAYAGLPSGVCAQCAGMGFGDTPGIDLSGDWEPDEKAYYLDGEYVEVPQPEQVA